MKLDKREIGINVVVNTATGKSNTFVIDWLQEMPVKYQTTVIQDVMEDLQGMYDRLTAPFDEHSALHDAYMNYYECTDEQFPKDYDEWLNS